MLDPDEHWTCILGNESTTTQFLLPPWSIGLYVCFGEGGRRFKVGEKNRDQQWKVREKTEKVPNYSEPLLVHSFPTFDHGPQTSSCNRDPWVNPHIPSPSPTFL